MNAGKYSASDVVFVSAEGTRAGRLDPDLKEIDRAMSAGATIITDPSDSAAMKRDHNVGERAVKAHLEKSGYVERAAGETDQPFLPLEGRAEFVGSDAQSVAMLLGEMGDVAATGEDGEQVVDR